MSGLDVDLTLCRRAGTGEAFRLQTAFSCAEGITVVFGPSGSGKTTLLLAILGALRPERGRVSLGGQTMFDSASGTDWPIHTRRIGIVFQDPLLFPHLTVRRNVAFGMKRTAQMSVDAWLERVGAAQLAGRMPAELSGGQRQRVALGRALAAEPRALLLDEPFSALDVAARESLGEMLIALQAETGVPFLHVTHDLGEALRMGDELIVIDEGRVVQTGSPAEVAAVPSSAATARAVGTENLFSGTIEAHHPDQGYSEVDLGGTRVYTGLLDLAVGGRVAIGLRAEDVLVCLEPLERTSARNVLPGAVDEISTRGVIVDLRVTTPVPFRVRVTPASVRELGLATGVQVYLLIKAAAFHRLL